MGLQSMTGFGRFEEERVTGTYSIEMKSVNNRYLDIQFRMPRLFNSLEQKMKKLFTDRLERGSVHLSINWTAPVDDMVVSYEPELAGKYVGILTNLSETYQLEGKPAISDLAPFYKEFITQELAEFSDDELWNDIEPVLLETIDALVAERIREGDFTTNELKNILQTIRTNLVIVSERAPLRLEKQQERLRKAVADLKGEGVDEARLTFELAIMAEKLDLAEEINRLSAHIEAMKELLDGSGAVGKRMGFLLQEMNRECNTIGSKANDSEISAVVVLLKEAVEKIREQSLNLV